jgi:hypothetical protein
MVVNYREIIFNKLVDSCRELLSDKNLPCEERKMVEELEQKFRYSYLDS